MVFEVQDLAQASPATVSRCGMVYVDSDELGWLPSVKTWAQSLIKQNMIPEQCYDILIDTFVSFVDNGFDFLKRNCAEGIHQVIYLLFLRISLAVMGLFIFDLIFSG